MSTTNTPVIKESTNRHASRCRWLDAQAQLEAELEPLRVELDRKQAAADQAKARWIDACRQADEVAVRSRDVVRRIDYARSTYEDDMRRLPEPEINAFLEWCDAQIDTIKRKRSLTRRPARTDLLIGVVSPAVEFANVGEMQTAASVVNWARNTALAWRFDPPEDLAEGLKELRATVTEALAF
jgi:hypothetical protein